MFSAHEYWWPSGTSILPINHRQHVTDDGVLEIEAVTRSADDGAYTCTASNPDGQSVSATLHVHILGKEFTIYLDHMKHIHGWIIQFDRFNLVQSRKNQNVFGHMTTTVVSWHYWSHNMVIVVAWILRDFPHCLEMKLYKCNPTRKTIKWKLVVFNKVSHKICRPWAAFVV